MASGFAARWNSKGNFVTYTAGSRALACLENLVHRSGEGLNQAFKVVVIEFPDDLAVESIELEQLPKKWPSYESYSETQNIGNKWIAAASSAVLKVPSSIITKEYNYLINPQHADFSKIKILDVEDFVFDSRIKST